MDLAKWWTDWQAVDHSTKFDFRASVPARILIRDLESFNDVRLLNSYLQEFGNESLVEIGCATGDLFRYIRLRHKGVSYAGFDVSVPAIERALRKYPSGNFRVISPDWTAETVFNACDHRRPQIVFCKDVIHHQVRPLEFLSRLLELPSEVLIFRGRTRDNGITETDPERSCQYHYNGWMPYIVSNLDELVQHIRAETPGSEIVAYRNHMVLGGKHNRYLPRDCYLEQTGTAETAIAVFMKPGHSPTVSIHDQADANPAYSIYEMFLLAARKLAGKTGARP